MFSQLIEELREQNSRGQKDFERLEKLGDFFIPLK